MGSRGAPRLAVRREAPQAAGAVPDRMLTIEMAPDEDMQTRAGAAPGLLGQRQRYEAGCDDVVAPDDPLVFDAEDLVQIDAAERHEGRSGVGGGPGELGVERWQEARAEVAIGGGDGADAGDAELVDQAVLQGPVDALTAAARLGRVAEDVLDAEGGPARARPG